MDAGALIDECRYLKDDERCFEEMMRDTGKNDER